MNKLIPSIIFKYKPIPFIKNNDYLVQVKSTLDKFDYNLKQQTPIIYLEKYDENLSSNLLNRLNKIMKKLKPIIQKQKILFNCLNYDLRDGY